MTKPRLAQLFFLPAVLVSAGLAASAPLSPGAPCPGEETQKARESSDAAPDPNPLSFAVGTWKTTGTQVWSDGSRVEHRGVVEGRLAPDGVTLERTFWAAFGNGQSLAGRSVHLLDPGQGTWSGRWHPTLGTWDATPAAGRREAEQYVEVARGVDASGRFTSTTRFCDITARGYRVRTDLVYDSGEVSEDNWTIRFERIPEDQPGEPITPVRTLDFQLGEWLAEGTVALPDGSEATHRSYVDAHLAHDGEAIEREFWGALSTGAALRGVSTHRPDPESDAWSVRWTPAGGPAQASARGEFEPDGFVEFQEQEHPTGAVTLRTRTSEITSMSYRVQTDILHADGDVTEAVWTVRFRRIG